jgi:hypothetical protein
MGILKVSELLSSCIIRSRLCRIMRLLAELKDPRISVRTAKVMASVNLSLHSTYIADGCPLPLTPVLASLLQLGQELVFDSKKVLECICRMLHTISLICQQKHWQESIWWTGCKPFTMMSCMQEGRSGTLATAWFLAPPRACKTSTQANPQG